MTTSIRQNNLLLNQDWTRIYQTFKNADFKSYDFENLRRVMIGYLRENYPEDFNDYIESSEYLALIDLLAFLGQSLAFRIDLASRENFIELAERKESVLRLARTLAYNSKRNIPAFGLLKFDTVSTTENILDSNGRNLARQIISWNDPSNNNWAEQFITVLNAAMISNVEFGKSQGTETISGITTDQYRFNTVSDDVPIFSFSKTVAARSMLFEVFSTIFSQDKLIYEESPQPGTQPGFIYKNDGLGPGSANTGFFVGFKQGSLEFADFAINVPTSNEIVAIDATGINNDDLWLYRLDGNGNQINEWTKVSTTTGNNIAYNSVTNNIRDIYSAITKDEDRVDLVFADGTYGNLPQGSFRIYYRVSNGLSYSIAPNELTGINLSIPYVNSKGDSQTLTVSCSLKYSVNNSTPSEDIDSIRVNAPAAYYTQNRMITAEDYNLAPLTSSQNILKVRAINRISSGVSRNFDVIDPSGRYSGVNMYGDDGYIYKEESESSFTFTPVDRLDAINFIRGTVEPELASTGIYNFYLTKFAEVNFSDETTTWVSSSSNVNQGTGYFKNSVDLSLLQVGVYTTNTLKYLRVGALIKFVPPTGYSFKRNQIVLTDPNDPEQINYIWTKAVSIIGDGTNAGQGSLATGDGPIVFSEPVPTGAIASRIVPKFTNNISTATEAEITTLINDGVNFGLRYDVNTSTWKIIDKDNLNIFDNFSTGRSGDISNLNLDSSWLVAFIKNADQYIVRIRKMFYVFGSLKQNRFYLDQKTKGYDPETGLTIKDQVKILGINTDRSFITPLKQDCVFEIDSVIEESDGYQLSNEIRVSFSDTDDDNVIDDPESFIRFVGEDSELRYLFFIKNTNAQFVSYQYVDNNDNTILIRQKETQVDLNSFDDGQLIYFYDVDEDVVKRVNKTTNTFDIQSNYKAVIGRDKIKFQYIHNADVDRRIDPGVSNIIDVFLLTKTYDTNYRNWLRGAIANQPETPTSDDLRISFGQQLNDIKSISDEIIYHPVKYKVLFGNKADERLRAVFKVVKNPNRSINNNNLKVRIIAAINEFFDVNNWDFGDRFYLGELVTYVINELSPDISNMVIAPRRSDQPFGDLFEIQSESDEIFVSGATVDDVSIVDSISTTELAKSNTTIVTGTSN